ncbi:putative SOS response-associated peptidase YedK [Rhizobium sp. PvP014]|nr:putative SOS response-associated peptidase YedK [Rhizobium sp. PvP014]MBP2528572.1 putative SOS response-associated peptidase YedK [Rhizobium sp. PvP099]
MSDEWGSVYSGAMTDANDAVRPVHDRMPALLHRDAYDRWLNGSFDDLLASRQRIFPSVGICTELTAVLWVKRKAAAIEEGLQLNSSPFL